MGAAINSPIVLIPGIMGSALHDDNNRRLWVNYGDLVRVPSIPHHPGHPPNYLTTLALSWSCQVLTSSCRIPILATPSSPSLFTNNQWHTIAVAPYDEDDGIQGVVDLDGTNFLLKGFGPLIKSLNPNSIKSLIAAAPYDWRLVWLLSSLVLLILTLPPLQVPQEIQMKAWVDQLKQTIIKLYLMSSMIYLISILTGLRYNDNNKKKVFLLAHSLGNLMALYFFHSVTQFNITDYVAGFLSSMWRKFN